MLTSWEPGVEESKTGAVIFVSPVHWFAPLVTTVVLPTGVPGKLRHLVMVRSEYKRTGPMMITKNTITVFLETKRDCVHLSPTGRSTSFSSRIYLCLIIERLSFFSVRLTYSVAQGL